jgi:hypothetical protein
MARALQESRASFRRTRKERRFSEAPVARADRLPEIHVLVQTGQ